MAKKRGLDIDKLLDEVSKRTLPEDQVKKFKIETFCFDKQIEFIRDSGRFKTAVCSRRAGKTISCAADLLETALLFPGDVAYITLSRKTAKRIIWRELVRINKEYALGGKPDNTELTMEMPNGNMIYISGAKDASEIEKFRGMALRKVYIDEAQSFRAYIRDLIEDVIEPALTDYYGTLVLIGTPGPIPAGFFYEITHNPEWSHYKWTMQDNPYIQIKSGKKPIEIIEELAKRRGLTIHSPSIQREYFGEWVKDVDSLVYYFDPARNLVPHLPDTSMSYIFGIDIGYVDSDAIAVLGYDHISKKVYLVEEYVRSKNDITSLVDQIKMLQKAYDPISMVMDAGALGKKIQEEIRQRHGLFIKAAEKHRKLEFITLLNDDLRTGKFKAKAGTRFQEDALLVQWDYSNPDKPKISDAYHTDIGDAVLYAWRECMHYLSEVPKPRHDIDSAEFMNELEAKLAEELEKSKHAEADNIEQSDLENLFKE